MRSEPAQPGAHGAWTIQAECDTPRERMAGSEASGGQATNRDGRIVLRNTMYLGIAEVLSMPISVLVNAMLGRYLGPANMGHLYLAGTISGFVFLIVGWGHHGPLPAAVAVDRTRAGTLLGTSMAGRVVGSLVAYALVAGVGFLLGLSSIQQWAIGLYILQGALSTFSAACQETIRGFERTDTSAYARVGSQLLTLLLVIPILLLGGGLRLTLAGMCVAAAAVLFALLPALGSVGIGKLRWDYQTFKELMIGGTPFVFFGLALALQPNVDAFYLARLSPEPVVGWYAVSQRLIGVLLVPATALIGGLYPTLCRLWVTDMDGFRRTTRSSVSTVSLLVVPIALGCALYPDIGVSIFGRQDFGPAEDNLRIASYYLYLVYFSMPVGTALVAAGKQRVWTYIQLACVANSAILDPFLVSYFQTHYGNGGMGLAVAAGVSETLMITAGIVLMPRGVLDRSFFKTLALTFLSSGAMVGAAFALRVLPSLLAAPLTVIAYGVALYLTGAVSREQLADLVGAVRRKLLRNRAAAS